MTDTALTAAANNLPSDLKGAEVVQLVASSVPLLGERNE